MRFRNGLISTSLANLVFIRIYAELYSTTASRDNHYHLYLPPSSLDFLAFGLNVVLLAAVLWTMLGYAQRYPEGPIAKCIWACVWGIFAIALFWTGRVIGLIPPGIGQRVGAWVLALDLLSAGVVLAAIAVFLAAFFFAFYRLQDRFRAVLRVALLLLAPFAAVTLAYSAFQIVGPARHVEFQANSEPFKDQSPREADHKHGRARVVFLLFDELDYRATFVERPASIQLPELDALRESSFSATNALPPANATSLSIPALTLGRLVENARPVDTSTLRLKISGSSELKSWNQLPNVFSDLHTLGFSTSVVGWHHPYCRLFAEQLRECSWYAALTQVTSLGDSLLEKMGNQSRSLLESANLSAFGQTLLVRESIRQYRSILKDAAEAVSDERNDFVWIHFPIPHAPDISNKGRSLSLANNLSTGYFGNLILVDETLRSVRQAMQDKGLWESTSIIVTSDHWWRFASGTGGKTDQRVPFIVKLANQRQPVSYEPRFNSTIMRSLIVDLLIGRIISAADLSEWLDRHGQDQQPITVPLPF